ncbi:mitochondrial ribonuclease P protein 3 [Seriola dumerili]|uniref:mitochondrial ribonuclease P protein 3 n=1 Tax=Seriola dumerili TaxID=41447 RepID=UPI000BBE5044|nr:mitochondrial ribonuclease P protein 3 [Seriola dumerili]
MGSNLISKVKICLKPLNPFLYQGSLAFLTMKTSQLATTARCLCTRDTNPKSGGRQTVRQNSGPTDGQGGVRYRTIRHRQGGLWEDTVDGGGKSSSLRQRQSFPKSVFSAGTAKRTAEMLKREASLASEDEVDPKQEPERKTTRGARKVQPPDRPLSVAEWRKLKESLGNPERFDIKMIHALFTSGAELDIAKSLLTFATMETGTLSYELLLRYLSLCVSGSHDAEVFDVYDIMRGSFSSLETGASTLFIKSFSRTARWKEAVNLLQEVKKVFTPSSRNYGDVIAAAVLHGDMTTAWALYDELMEKGLSPHQETWDALFKGVKKTKEVEGLEEAMSQPEHQERLLGILLHMRNNQIYPQYSLASSIKTSFESLPGQKWKGSWTSATPKGLCRCCGSELESIQLTVEEYQQLKDRVMTDIIQGQDVFNKTTPEELEHFKAFVQRKPAFDVVVDGLNVANINKDKSKLSATLLAVVSDLERQGLTVLVLGRKHMLRATRSWERHNMNLIQEKAHCFFTDDISEDDPFLLYATLHSGNHCRFVSRDLMRDHKACLPDGATRRLFFKWQRGHQLVVDGLVVAGRRVQFQSILKYDTTIQTSGDSWHVPYDDTEDRSTYEVPQRWLCLTQKH